MTAAQGSVAASVKAEMGRDRQEAGFGQDDLLGQHAVDFAAQGRADLGFGGRSLQPARRECRDDPIADAEPGRALAQGRHLAGCVGHGNQWQLELGVIDALGDQQVAEIERGRADADAHLSRTGLGARQLLELPGFRTAERMQSIGSHQRPFPIVLGEDGSACRNRPDSMRPTLSCPTSSSHVHGPAAAHPPKPAA